MTDIPCYKKEPNKCLEYNETDINSKNQDNNSERLSIIHKKTKSVS